MGRSGAGSVKDYSLNVKRRLKSAFYSEAQTHDGVFAHKRHHRPTRISRAE